MTKPMNQISRVTQRRQGALDRITVSEGYYYNKDKEVATLQKRIDAVPQGKVKTKKKRAKS